MWAADRHEHQRAWATPDRAFAGLRLPLMPTLWRPHSQFEGEEVQLTRHHIEALLEPAQGLPRE
jgi:hypothetical protein